MELVGREPGPAVDDVGLGGGAAPARDAPGVVSVIYLNSSGCSENQHFDFEHLPLAKTHIINPVFNSEFYAIL